MSHEPVHLDAEPIAAIFDHLVKSIQNSITYDSMAVDVELHLRSVSIERKGIFFRSKQKESSAEIRLVTRVRNAE